jgi:DNA modification methylase
MHLQASAPLLDLTDRGDVINPFLGSGSTLVVVDKTGRVHRSVEFDPLYAECDRAALRGRACNQADRLPHQVPNEHAENTRKPKRRHPEEVAPLTR